LEEVREMLDLYDLGDGRHTQLQVALAKFQERVARLEEQRAEIDRAIAELARASLEIQAMLSARANDEGGTDADLSGCRGRRPVPHQRRVPHRALRQCAGIRRGVA